MSALRCALLTDRAPRESLVFGALVWGTVYIILREALPPERVVSGVLARVGLFIGLLSATVSYAWRRGGAPERIVAITLAVQTIAAPIQHMFVPARFAQFDPGRTASDAIVATIIVAISLKANRHWPLLAAAFAVAPVVFHVAVATHATPALAYAALSIFWSYPLLAVLAGGTLRHQMRRKVHGCDGDWTVHR